MQRNQAGLSSSGSGSELHRSVERLERLGEGAPGSAGGLTSRRRKLARTQALVKGFSGMGIASLGVDEIIKITGGGGLGRFQWKHLGIIAYVEAACATITSLHVFIAEDVSREFGLTAPQTAVLGTLFFIGFFLGVPCFGYMGDKYGRARTLLLSAVLTQIVLISYLVLPSGFMGLAIWRTSTGFCYSGLTCLCWTLLSEICLSDDRPLAHFILQVSWTVGMVLTVGMAYYVDHSAAMGLVHRDWRVKALGAWIIAMPCSPLILQATESIRWLHSQHKLEETSQAAVAMAELNRSTQQVLLKEQELEGADPEAPADADDDKLNKPTQLDTAATAAAAADKDPLVIVASQQNAAIRTRVLVMCCIWFSVALGYYGLTMHSTIMGGSVYTTSLSGAFAELPAKFLFFRLVNVPRLGRRYSVGGGAALGGAACMLGILLHEYGFQTGAVWSIAIGRGLMGAVLGGVYLYAAELFPTSLRSAVLGTLSSAARVGAMAGPMCSNDAVSAEVSSLLLGVPNILAGLLVTLILPETRGSAMG